MPISLDHKLAVNDRIAATATEQTNRHANGHSQKQS
jgi:hypothetical protein